MSHPIDTSSTLAKFIDERIALAQNSMGYTLPARVVSVQGQLVTIELAVKNIKNTITVPLASSPYVLLPIKAGDVGIAVKVHAGVADISGMGGNGTPSIGSGGNFSDFVFLPIATQSTAVNTPNELTLKGVSDAALEAGSKRFSVVEFGNFWDSFMQWLQGELTKTAAAPATAYTATPFTDKPV